MKRQDDQDALRAFSRLLSAAEAFVNRAPKVKRIEVERTELLDAISEAQLMLSVRRLPPLPARPQHKSAATDPGELKAQLNKARAALRALHAQLSPLQEELSILKQSAARATELLEQAVKQDSAPRAA